MLDQSALWSVVIVLGPVLLLAGLAYGVMMYRRRSRASRLHTEQATRDLYRDATRREQRDGSV